MKEEIKEILDEPKILMLSYGNYISLEDYVKLKDYITNLEQELQITQEKWDKDKQFIECRTKEWLDYKSRNEKAILGLQNIKVACHFAGYKKIEKMIEKEQFFLAGGDEE